MAMVKYSRELELALGDGIKKVEGNEIESKIVQRRALRASKDLPSGSILCKGTLLRDHALREVWHQVRLVTL